MKKKDFMSLIVYAAGFVAVWNVLDFLYSTFISRTPYRFSITTDMLVPLVVMLIIQSIEMSRKK